jgi:hypothetical protein
VPPPVIRIVRFFSKPFSNIDSRTPAEDAPFGWRILPVQTRERADDTTQGLSYWLGQSFILKWANDANFLEQL